jgi:hypothetical protein
MAQSPRPPSDRSKRHRKMIRGFAVTVLPHDAITRYRRRADACSPSSSPAPKKTS